MFKRFFLRENVTGFKKFRKFRIFISILLIMSVVKIVSTKIENVKGRDLRTDDDYLDTLKEADGNQPNVIVILADDLGYGDISSFGSEGINTPNLDQLAEEGTALTNYYAPSPVCSPSRAGLLTGRYPYRSLVPDVFQYDSTLMKRAVNLLNHMTDTYAYGVESIPEDEIMLQEVLSEVGYDTALIGKWHLGAKEGELPNDHGFDYFYGGHYSNDFPDYDIYRNEEKIHDNLKDQSNLTKELTDEAVNFIQENKEEPFFLYYASPFPHYPHDASDDFKNTSDAGLYGDCVEELDWSIGEIMNTLAEEGIDDNTIVIFTSDNGPWFEGSPLDLRGRKGNSLEGGQKVPFIAWMPGTIEAGVVNDGLSSGLDVFPTILELLNIDLPSDRIIDGVSLLSYLKGDETESPREDFVFLNGKKVVGYVKDDLKYMRKYKNDNAKYSVIPIGPYLFDLSIQYGESYDVSIKYPEIVEEYENKLVEFENVLDTNLRGWIEN